MPAGNAVVIDTDDRDLTVFDPAMVGRAVAVTGAGRGMGEVFAQGLTARGINVVGCDLREGELNAAMQRADRVAVAASSDARAIAVPGDVTDPTTHARLRDAALHNFGRLDGWINNAGIWATTPALDVTGQEIKHVYDVNLNGVLYGSQAAAAHLATHGGGSIVNVSSISAFVARKGGASYNSSKEAVAHLTRVLALEFGELGIRVNAIAPGLVDTDLLNWVRADEDTYERAVSRIPLGRIGAPIEVFGLVYFLLGDSSRYVTGQNVLVDGGRVLG